MEFIIEKSKWNRNRCSDPNRPTSYARFVSYLLNQRTGMMCCLGFCSLQTGTPVANISDKYMPSDVRVKMNSLFQVESYFGGYRNTNFSLDAARINDDGDTSDEQKILLLTDLFKEAGHSIKFVD